jgi:hypothetical protein
MHRRRLSTQPRADVEDLQNSKTSRGLVRPAILQRADRFDGDDPQTGTSTPLFNPRRDKWHDHFGWNGCEVNALTSVARATIITLDLNRPRLLIRKAEELFDLFPPR